MARRSIGKEEHWLGRSPCQGGVPARRNFGQEEPQPGEAPAKRSSGKEDLRTERALGGPLAKWIPDPEEHGPEGAPDRRSQCQGAGSQNLKLLITVKSYQKLCFGFYGKNVVIYFL